MNDPYLAVKSTLLILLPETILLIAGTAIMTAAAFIKAPRRVWALASLATFCAALLALLAIWGVEADPYSIVIVNDGLSKYARLAFLFFGVVLLALAHDQVDDNRAGEFFGALILIHAGAMLVSAANELILLFVGLELVSIPTYLLLYLSQRNPQTREAATKYFFLSIFSSAILLFGMAYLYGIAGVSNLKALAYLQRIPGIPHPQIGLIAVVFVLAGLAFRVAAVPLHFYAPDVYEGSPTILAALLSWVPKGIGFIAVIRLLTSTLGGDNAVADKGVMLAWVIAVASMTLGNTVALLQENLKRLLAYSSIAHAGYLMIGVTVAFHNIPNSGPVAFGAEGILFYLLAYALMTLGVFGAIIALSTAERPIETIDDLAGLSRSHPWMAAAMTVCLFSLAGVPPMAGFLGKFQLFTSTITLANGDFAQTYQWLAVIGALNAAVGAYYYLRVVVTIYLRKPGVPVTTKVS